MLKKHILILLFLAASLPFAVLGRSGYRSTYYTSNEGLPSSQICNVFQDSRDFLWVGTIAGLSRFDGHSFVNYGPLQGIRGSQIMAIDEDSLGHIWVATNQGLYEFNGIHFRRLNFNFLDIKDILPVGDKIWIATKGGLFAYSRLTGCLQYFSEQSGLLSNSTSCLLRLNNGNILVGTAQGIYEYDGRMRPYWTSSGDSYIMAMREDRQGRVWFATLSNGTYFRRADTVVNVDRDSVHEYLPRCILLNDQEEILVAHEYSFEVFKNGVYQDSFFCVTDMSNGIFDAIQDREGNYWIATGYGLLAMRPTQVRYYKTPPIPNAGLYRFPGDSAIYLSTCQDIFRLNGDTVVNLFPGKPTSLGCVEVFEKVGENQFILGTRFGDVQLYKDGKFKKLVSPPVWNSCSTEEGAWLAASNALLWYHDDSLQTFSLSTGAPYKMKFNSIAPLPGKAHFVLGAQRGLCEFKDGKFRDLPLAAGDDLLVTDICPAGNDRYLLATKGYGLLCVSIINGKASIIGRLNSQNGLGSDYVNRIVHAGQHTYYLIAMNGVYKVSDLFGNRNIEYIGPEDGMLRNSWVSSDVLIDPYGRVYVAGSGGLLSFPKTVNFLAPVVQKTHLTRIIVNNEPYNWGRPDSVLSFTGFPAGYTFSHDRNSLTFFFTGVNLSRPSSVRYQYRLQGYKPDLVTTATPSVNFNDLPPGDYYFQVRSSSNESFSSEPFTGFRFTIRAPFWMTWWFRIAVLATLAGLLWALYRRRLRDHTRKQQLELAVEKQLNEGKMLAFQARMNPHFIFNSLNAIQYFMMNNDKIATLNYLSKFAKLLRQILDNTIDIKVNLEKEIEMLRSYIEIEELRFDNQFTYEIDVSPGLFPSNIEIPGMIIQPFVENAIIHGLLHKNDSGFLRISFSSNASHVICIVEDNGIGRTASGILNEKKSTKYQSHGTAIAETRLQLLGGGSNGINSNIMIEDLYHQGAPAGTRVRIQIPIL